MKKLYYNPIEVAEKIKIKSRCFGVDITYAPDDESTNPNGCPSYMGALFGLAKSDCFEEVAVFLTSHNEAYISDGKKKVDATGWVSLKGIADGGGYLGDKHIYIGK